MKNSNGDNINGWEGLKSKFAINTRHGNVVRDMDSGRVVAKINAVRQAAELAHEIKRMYCNAIGMAADEPWSKMKYTQREAVTDRVMDIIEKGDMSPREFHERWMNRKKNCGWKNGKQFSRTAMTDPFIDDWESLPIQVRMIDTLFVDCVSGYLSAILHSDENLSKKNEDYDIDALIEDTDMTMFEQIEHCVKKYPYFLRTLVQKFEEVGLDIKPESHSSKRAYAKRIIRACIQDPSIFDSVMKVLSPRT
jgi:hypothetical protein